MPQGTLFTDDFLNEGIRETDIWCALTPEALAEFRAHLQTIFDGIADPSRLNEAQTEERIVQPLLKALGWEGCYSVQERAEAKGRANVPDYLLFPTPEAFAAADRKPSAAERYPFATATGDAKAWAVGLDKRGAGAAGDETPSGQIIRYLTRADVQSNGRVLWAVLTNGRHWRLYYQRAKSRLEEYFEIDLAWALGLPGAQGELGASARPALFASDRDWSDHLLKLMWLMFRREAFLPQADGRSFHQLALDEGRNWEAKVRETLADVVFEQVFPDLARALARADRERPPTLDPAYLARVRDAALTLLYRLLFALYAEDRDLLPKRDPRYGGLSHLRDEVAERIDAATVLSRRRTAFAHDCADLFRTIDEGDEDIGVPPYNGGLFSDRNEATALLDRALLPDADFAPLLDRLARTEKGRGRVRINFRDLSVQQLGSIYERLLEYEPIADADAPDGIAIRLNPFARKGSGSYYTPDELVKLIIERTVGPLVKERIVAFEERAQALASDTRRIELRLDELRRLDPAERILDLKIVDPAMGSGHFLVSLVDYLAEEVTTAIGEAHEAVAWADYVSPLVGRLAAIWAKIRGEADARGWAVRDEQLADKNLVKRFVLKRCVYGVDKNPMAVELAKVSLWLHTFTAGAPLSFLNHHLKCGDSLYGEWVRKALDALQARGSLLISDAVKKAEGAIAGMEMVESLTDAEIAEVKASASAFHDVEQRTEPLRKFLDFWHALKWLDLDEDEKQVLDSALDGSFGQPLIVLAGFEPPQRPADLSDAMLASIDALRRMSAAERATARITKSDLAAIARDFRIMGSLVDKAHALAAEQRFLHWQIAFPGVWRSWTSAAPEGGFDAVIGNPPWDRMKMQEVEWFAARAPTVAKQARAADRKTKIAEMKAAGDQLIPQYERAAALAERAMRLARKSGDYPLLSKGDINIYALFVERAQALIKPAGMAGLLVPSGIASDYGASAFFRQIAAAGRVRCLFDFENRRGEGRAPFFPDVDSRFKFCAFVCGGEKRKTAATECAFFLSDPPERVGPAQRFTLAPADFALVNPNTGTAPIFRTKRDAELTTAIYRRLPVLVDRSSGAENKAWPVRYLRMFDMTNDSHLFWTRERLEQEGAYPGGLWRWRKGEREWMPLYEGKMVQAFDHRAADVVVNPDNVHRPAQPEPLDENEHADPARLVTPQYWVESEQEVRFGLPSSVIGFKEITSPTNERGMIAAFLPAAGYGNTIPVIYPELDADCRAEPSHDHESRGKPTAKPTCDMGLWLGA